MVAYSITTLPVFNFGNFPPNQMFPESEPIILPKKLKINGSETSRQRNVPGSKRQILGERRVCIKLSRAYN